MASGIVALLTDFGYRDAYAGIMEAVVLRSDPGLTVVTVTHGVDAHDVLSASYLLYSAWEHFPPGTVFCAVVDPGVGSDRAVCVARAAQRLLVAPDNGLASLVARMCPGFEAFRLASAPPAGGADAGGGATAFSATFHGRDVFAPVAAAVASRGLESLHLEPLAPVLLPQVRPEAGPQGVRGRVLHVDRFGNCITSIHRRDLAPLGELPALMLHAGARELRGGSRTYAEVRPGQPLFLLGSSGFLEVAVREGSAARRLDVRSGQEVYVNRQATAP